MTRAEEALKEIREKCWGYDIPSPTVPEYRELHEEMQDLMKTCDKWLEILKKGEWIPCAERLPDEDGTYLATRETHNGGWAAGTAIYVASTKSFYPASVAWMRLPDPYKGGDEK